MGILGTGIIKRQAANLTQIQPSKGNQTMINGVVKATSGSGTLNNPPSSNQVAGSDFTLVELNTSIPSSYNTRFGQGTSWVVAE